MVRNGKLENNFDGFEKYPALRDHPLRTAAQWIRGRAIDNNCGQLWRVHDNLYDLTDFIKIHPGGQQWLEVTRGTDITEAFESSHLSPNVYDVLAKYLVRPAEGKRNSPYSLQPDGFYMTLKKRVYKYVSTQVSPEEKELAQQRIATVMDRIVFTFIVLLIATALTQSYWLAVLAGAVLMMDINSAHNFYHQKDNWRMYYYDLGLLSSYEWRITHSLSHHVFPNTLWDFECAVTEPFGDFRVRPKSFIQRFLPTVNLLTVSQFAFFIEGFKRIVSVSIGHQKLRPENLLPLAELLFMWLLGCPLVQAVKLWFVIHAASSYFFSLIGYTVAHHHPDLLHAGDGLPQFGNDWGLFQLDAVRNRKDVDGILLAEMTMYGNHTLHHLFPTLDHGMLDFVRPIFEQTCKDFNLPVGFNKPYNQWDMIVGVVKQAARIEPRSKLVSKSN